MAVSVKTDPTFSLETPKVLFRGTYIAAENKVGTPWDISPDGKRFLMLRAVQSTEKVPATPAPRKISVVLNWTEELKKRVPVHVQ